MNLKKPKSPDLFNLSEFFIVTIMTAILVDTRSGSIGTCFYRKVMIYLLYMYLYCISNRQRNIPIVVLVFY